MKSKIKMIIILLVCIFFTVNLWGCAPSEEASEQESSPDPAGGGEQGAELEPIKLGFVGVLTGASAENGEYCSRGAILAVEEINASGGVQIPGEEGKREFELLLEDDQGTPQGGMNAIQKHINQNNVFAILGSDYSGVTYPSMELTRDAVVPQFTSSLAPKITAEGHPTIFRTRTNDYYRSEAAVSYFVEELGIEKIALAYTNNEYGKTGIDEAENHLKKKYGIEPLVKVSHDYGDRDLSSSAVAIKQSNADGVISWGIQQEHALLYKELRSIGYEGTFYFSDVDDIFGKLLTDEELDGIIGTNTLVPSDTRPKAAEFIKNYNERFGMNPDTHSAAYYDAVYFIKHVLEQTSLDVEEFVAFARAVPSWEGTQGTWRPADFGNGDVGTFVTVYRMEGRTPVVIHQYD
ncbi:MAG: ABC transporter substrate-binding protein [Dethiobacteria bacterium]